MAELCDADASGGETAKVAVYQVDAGPVYLCGHHFLEAERYFLDNAERFVAMLVRPSDEVLPDSAYAEFSEGLPLAESYSRSATNDDGYLPYQSFPVERFV